MNQQNPQDQQQQPPAPWPPPYTYDDEIDLLELIRVLWQAKWTILGSGLAVALIVAIYSRFLPDEYEASALLASAQESGGGVPSRLSGLASMAGVNLGNGGGSNPTVVAVETLRSRSFLIDFIKRRNLEPQVAATTGYNREKGVWQYDTDRYRPQEQKWTQPPSDWNLYNTLRNRLTVNHDSQKGLVNISLTAYSPEAAARWLNWLVADLNQHLMEQDVKEAERSITYLQEKLEETALTEMREVFYQLIEQQTRTIMLARAKPEYALRTLDPAMPPEVRSSPKRSLMVAVGLIFGLMLAVLVVFIRRWIRHCADEEFHQE